MIRPITTILRMLGCPHADVVHGMGDGAMASILADGIQGSLLRSRRPVDGAEWPSPVALDGCAPNHAKVCAETQRAAFSLLYDTAEQLLLSLGSSVDPGQMSAARHQIEAMRHEQISFAADRAPALRVCPLAGARGFGTTVRLSRVN